MTEREKMLTGALYQAGDPELAEARRRAEALCGEFNEAAAEERGAVLERLLGAVGENVMVMPRFACDYGFNIRLGSRVFINYNCVFLDCAPIEIGDDVLIGPAVQLYTAGHPLEAEARRTGLEWARPIRIGRDVWIGGGAIVLPGVTIGEGSVVGAGSVVTRDVPPRTIVAGAPARPVRVWDEAARAWRSPE